jgi:predicted permease
LPLNLLASAGQPFSKELSYGLLLVSIAAVLYYVCAIIISNLLSKGLKASEAEKRVFVAMSTFQNAGFIGIPLSSMLFGDDGVLYAVICNMVFQLFFFTYGQYKVSGEKRLSLRSLTHNPLVLVSLLSVGLYLSPFRFPDFMQGAIKSIGDMMVPLSMILIGCSLMGIRPTELLKDKHAYFISALRLVIFPLATLVIAKLIGLTGAVGVLCVVLAGLPSGAMNVVFAQQYNCAPDFAARVSIQGVIFMAVTLPILIFVATTVLG